MKNTQPNNFGQLRSNIEGNDRQSWSDELLGGLPNIYFCEYSTTYEGLSSLMASPSDIFDVFLFFNTTANTDAANNPSESILAKRRGYGTLVRYGSISLKCNQF